MIKSKKKNKIITIKIQIKPKKEYTPEPTIKGKTKKIPPSASPQKIASMKKVIPITKQINEKI